MAESENVARGLVPRWGRGGASHNPPCHFAVPSLNSGFSYLGVPAVYRAIGTDWATAILDPKAPSLLEMRASAAG